MFEQQVTYYEILDLKWISNNAFQIANFWLLIQKYF